MDNLSLDPGYRAKVARQKVEVLDKYKPKKKEKNPVAVCQICELFYHDESALRRHQSRRHHILCHKCHASSVLVQIIKDTQICKDCFEVNKKLWLRNLS